MTDIAVELKIRLSIRLKITARSGLVRGEAGKMDLRKSTVRDLRHINRVRLLRRIYSGGPISRFELSRSTGLSPATVTNVTAELLSEGIITESGSEESDGGRPRTLLSINPAHGRFVGIDVGETHIQIGLFDVALRRLATATQPLSMDENQPNQVVGHIVEGLEMLLAESGVRTDEIIGVGLGVPGLVDPAGGVSIFAPNWGWHDVPLMDMLEDQLRVRAHLDNGAKAMALAEMWFGAGKGAKSLAVLLIGTGVGAGIIAGGTLYRGASNSAGEWGHTTIELDGRECRCGSRGCLEAYVGAPGIIQSLREECPDSPLLREDDQMAAINSVVSAARQGDAVATRVMEKTVHYLGAGVANLVNLFNPELIVLGGRTGLLIGEYVLPRLHRVAERYSLKQPFNRAKIGLSRLRQDAVSMGAATLALEDFLTNAGRRGVTAPESGVPMTGGRLTGEKPSEEVRSLPSI